MSAHDGLPRTQFGDVAFPGETHDVDGEFREYTHEYPHAPGGAPEKLGRRLYVVTVRGNFQATFTGYPDLYPNGMNKLRGYFELGATLPFTHPTIGTFPAFITRWKQVKTARLRSGESVDITFKEDQAASFALAATVVSADDTAMAPTAAQLARELALVKDDLTVTPTDLSVFDALQVAVNDVVAIRDTSSLYGNLYASKIDQVARLCAELDAAASMQDARAWPVVDILHEVWAASIRLQRDLQSQRAELATYVVPYTMPISTVALNLFGDASKASDILPLNSDRIDDPLRIRAGTQIRYYPLSAQEQAAKLAG